VWRQAAWRVREARHYRPKLEDIRGPANCALSFLIALPAAMLWMALGPFVIYPPSGYIDPWIYTGYFTNFHHLMAHKGLTYYVSRLPWILPGRLAFAIARPEVASLLLCGGIVAVSAVSLYWMVRWYYGRAPAVLASVMLVTNPYFMASAGWQYPDGAAIAYATAGMALYLRPTGSRRWNSFWAAAMLLLSGATNMAGGPMILAVLVFPLWRCRHSVKEFLKEAVCSVAGAAAAAYVLTRLSQRMFGLTNFLWPQIQQTLRAAQTPGYLAGEWGSGPGFLLEALRLFTPAFLLVFGLVLLVAIRKPAAAAWPAYLALLVCCAFYSFVEFVLHGVALRVFYHSSYMQVVVLGFAGVALGETWRRTPGSGKFRAVWAAWLAAAGIALCLAFSSRFLVVPNGRGWSTLAAVGAAAIVLAVLARWPKLPVQHLTCALLMAAVFLGPALDYGTWFVWASPKLVHGSNLTATANAAAFRRLMDLENYVKSHVEMPRALLFWWEDDEPHSPLFTSGAMLFLCSHENVEQGLATGDVGRLYDLFGYSTTIVHLTSHPERIAQRAQMMVARGVLVDNERRTAIEYGGGPFTVVLQDVVRDPRARH
jgi:hypothetical protein